MMNFALVCVVALAAWTLSDSAVANECAVHRFDELGKKSATIVLAPTERAPEASGTVQVKIADAGRSLRIDVRDLPDPTGIRPEYLTYVAWAVPQAGPIVPLGEIRSDGGKARLSAGVASEIFGLIVTAEPHFATSQPSDSVVLQSVVEGKLAERLPTAQVRCELLAGDRFAYGRTDVDLAIQLKPAPKTSTELLQARNARKIAELAGAERLAKEPFAEASRQLVEAEQFQARKPGNKDVVAPAKASVAAAEQAYVAALAGQKREQEAAERAAALAREKAEQLEQQRAAREAEEAGERARRDAEMKAIQERQQQLEREVKAEAERRAALEKQLAKQGAGAAAKPPAAPGAPAAKPGTAPAGPASPSAAAVDASSDLRAERERLDAERAKLQAERAQAKADMQAERARIDAERATMRAQLAVENAEREREENKTARAETEAARRDAETARVAAERARHEAELAAERARGEVERARLEAEIKTRESERQRLAKEEAAAAPAVTALEIEAAKEAQIERARLQAELSAIQQSVEQERARVAAEQKANALQQELDRTKLETDRTQLQTERDKLREQLDAERAARKEAADKQNLDRAADERRREEARVAREAERLKLQADAEKQQAAIAASREAQAKREQELEAERVRMQKDLEAERVRMQKDLEAERLALRQTAEAEDAAREQLRLQERADRRARLLEQLTEVLAAKDTERGLVVNMSEISFDPGRSELKPAARVELARISGILLAHPGLKLDLEGHTDSTGSAEGNQALSEKRATAVRDFFVSQGLSAEAMTARGFGASRPVASNDTVEGRKTNRRIECVISGAEIDAAK